MGFNTQDNAEIYAGVYIKATEAERIAGVERRTLFRWARAGRLPYVRSGERGHWMFDRHSVYNLAGFHQPQREPDAQHGRTETQPVQTAKEESKRKQREYLETQIQGLKSKYTQTQ